MGPRNHGICRCTCSEHCCCYLRALFMRWGLDASVCVHACISVATALVHGCPHCRRVREGTMGPAGSLGCYKPGCLCIPTSHEIFGTTASTIALTVAMLFFSLSAMSTERIGIIDDTTLPCFFFYLPPQSFSSRCNTSMPFICGVAGKAVRPCPPRAITELLQANVW